MLPSPEKRHLTNLSWPNTLMSAIKRGISLIPHQLRLQGTNCWPDLVLQDFLVESSMNYITLPSIISSRSEATDQPQAITPPPPCLIVDPMFFLWNAVSFTPNLTGLKPSKISSPRNILPEVSGDILMFLSREMGLCVLLGQHWFSPWNSPRLLSLPVSFIVSNHEL